MYCLDIDRLLLLRAAVLIFNINYVQLVSGYEFCNTMRALIPQTIPSVQGEAVTYLIKRLIGEKSKLFNVIVDPAIAACGKDTFLLQKNSSSDILEIKGSSGVAAAWGFHHYLKYYCNCHVSWEADQLNLPDSLPNVVLNVTANDWIRYYQNVCTTSYSFIWWSWHRWEREIDWMALNGINMALAFTAQEEMWRRVYMKLNLTEAEIQEHFTGPAFLAWGRMGNIRGWGGPLSKSWHQKCVNLQKKILNRMREFGIIPVLPGFNGQVPRAFKRLFPHNNLTLIARWNNFDDEFCCPYLLSPDDNLFHKIGYTFLTELISEFGTNHVYNVDTFNELTPPSGELTYLASLGQSVYRTLASADSEAIWMLQGWLFFNNRLFWSKERANALLTSVPLGRMLVLDLMAELAPQYLRLDSFFGQPYIWCMLHNFGGTLGMHGTADRINREVHVARRSKNSSLVGTGITPEGINQNYVIYDLMNEMSWRKFPTDLNDWFSNYSNRRYGQNNEHMDRAWQLLKNSVYSYNGTRQQHGKYIFVHEPKLNLIPDVWYDVNDIMKAWDELQKAVSVNSELHKQSTFQYDCVDITRQSLQLLLDHSYQKIIKYVFKKNVTWFEYESQRFLNIMMDLDNILGSNKAFLLSAWLNSAKLAASDPEESKLFEMNARNQITLWGPKGEIKDYANKQWAGLVADYYYKRWKLYFVLLKKSLISGKPFNQTEAEDLIFQQVELPFTRNRNLYPPIPRGNTIKIAIKVYKKWRYIYN